MSSDKTSVEMLMMIYIFRIFIYLFESIYINLMFGSKSRKGEQLLTPKYIENLRRTYSNTNTSHFFQTLLETSQMTYLDPNKIYCMIKTNDFMKLKEELKKRSEKQQSLEKEVMQLMLVATKLSKQVQVYKDNLQRQRQSEKKLIEQHQNIISRQKQLEAINYNLQKRLQERNNSFYSLQARSVQNQNHRKIVKNVESSFVQTQVFPNSFEIISVEKIVMENEQKVENIDDKQKMLCQLLQTEMNKFQDQFEKKLAQLQEKKLKIESWEEENRQLRQQNESLRQKMFERNIQQEKLNVWRNTVSNFVSKIEMTMSKPKTSLNIEEISENPSSQQTRRLKNEVIELRAKIVEMKTKMKKIDEVMADDKEIADEGVIGKMLQLSQRIKSIVKGMIVQVQIGQI